MPSAEVARAGGGDLDRLRAAGNRGAAVDVMLAGARSRVPELYAERRFDDVLGLGGGGTAMITAAKRTLPIGVPRLMVSTLARATRRRTVTDITMGAFPICSG